VIRVPFLRLDKPFTQNFCPFFPPLPSLVSCGERVPFSAYFDAFIDHPFLHRGGPVLLCVWFPHPPSELVVNWPIPPFPSDQCNFACHCYLHIHEFFFSLSHTPVPITKRFRATPFFVLSVTPHQSMCVPCSCFLFYLLSFFSPCVTLFFFPPPYTTCIGWFLARSFSLPSSGDVIVLPPGFPSPFVRYPFQLLRFYFNVLFSLRWQDRHNVVFTLLSPVLQILNCFSPLGSSCGACCNLNFLPLPLFFS